MEKNPIFCLLATAVWLFGLVGGFGYLWYDGHYPFAIAVVCIAAMAFPKVKEYFKVFV